MSLKEKLNERKQNNAEEVQFEHRREVWTPEKREYMLRKHQIEVRVSSFENGLEVSIGARLVRIKSRYYNLLILKGYLPTMGEIDGDVSFVVGEDEKFFRDIKGFFMYKPNVFYLMIK